MQFQHTAARRRLGVYEKGKQLGDKVSTHSRPKAAGKVYMDISKIKPVSTHSRPKAAGFVQPKFPFLLPVSTHSRPKAAGKRLPSSKDLSQFQHTAARRRLATAAARRVRRNDVSTHSCPKAAGRFKFYRIGFSRVSTHSRPKAAGSTLRSHLKPLSRFNT